MRLSGPFGSAITEAYKSSEVLAVRRRAGGITLPVFDNVASQRFVASPDIAENRTWLPPNQAMGAILSCPEGGAKCWALNADIANAFVGGPPV